ncbi:hypothetical protein B0T26DRAFT_752836 [Lasiosphaeria miniovina]|uniref:Uncharacterized protein n=1 Tax=Lasiosphaeria miniovina TaxID=1954250 RepID=A0AA40DRA0_9PEZI|nr:uncharacterized protein B0T26DRAFT_752836 [Lasiosphaeria miniovina]KAK0712625.1 hypothetical protein B0T26DRAFT_752836 [Lasiosphaeria miniovina]
MRPFELEDITYYWSENNPMVLMLNTQMATASFMQRLVSKGGHAHITSKGQGQGTTLPAKVWSHIIDILAADADANPVFILTQATLANPEVDPAVSPAVLACIPIHPKLADHSFGAMRCAKTIQSFEDAMAFRQVPPLGDPAGVNPKVIFFIGIDEPPQNLSCCADSGLHLRAAVARLNGGRCLMGHANRAQPSTAPQLTCLYSDIDLPDIIARVEGGICGACDGARFVGASLINRDAGRKRKRTCHDSNGDDHPDRKRARSLTLLEAAGVLLACPVCLGTKTCEDHRAYFDSRAASSAAAGSDNTLRSRLVFIPEDSADVYDDLRERLDELGYADVPVSTAALVSYWGGAGWDLEQVNARRGYFMP